MVMTSTVLAGMMLLGYPSCKHTTYFMDTQWRHVQTPKRHGPLGNSEINELIVSLTIGGFSWQLS